MEFRANGLRRAARTSRFGISSSRRVPAPVTVAERMSVRAKWMQSHQFGWHRRNLILSHVRMGQVFIFVLILYDKPPLCKGRWHGIAVTEGLSKSDLSRKRHIYKRLQSLSLAFGSTAPYRSPSPLSLRDISPHCGESPFTQGSLLSRFYGWLS